MKGGKMWLLHLLPKDLPNTRIVTYGYNSNLFEDASVGRIRDFAKGLLNAVDGYRTREVYTEAATGYRLSAKRLMQPGREATHYLCMS
jgi:hypothetical protein